MSATIEQADNDLLVAEMRRLLTELETVELLCDLTDFPSQDATAWLSDSRFGRGFHQRISRMAIVGDSGRRPSQEVRDATRSARRLGPRVTVTGLPDVSPERAVGLIWVGAAGRCLRDGNRSSGRQPQVRRLT